MISKRSRIFITILKEKKKVRRLTLHNFKSYYNATFIRTAWYLEERYYYPNLKTNTGIELSPDESELIIGAFLLPERKFQCDFYLSIA